MKFADERVKEIWDCFARGRTLRLIHHAADDVPMSGRTIRIDGRDYINFVTCSYLGLEFDKRIIDGISAAAEKYGATFSVSRTFVSSPPFAEFEILLARIFGAYPVVASSTTLAHFSFMSVMIQPGDVVLFDQQVHNSVQMAAHVVSGKAKLAPVRHNDMERLERLIGKYLAMPGTNNVWYCADGVYSMFGDVAPVSKLVALLEKYDRFHLYLDDAHGMSIQGRYGRGFVLSKMDRIHPRLVVAVSLAKCFGIGCGAAILLSNPEWQDKIRTCGATMIFSGPIPPPMLGAGIESAKIHLSEEFPALQADLQGRIRFFRNTAEKIGIPLVSSPDSPIQYVMVGDFEKALRVAKAVFDSGFILNICAYPAVGINHTGLRLAITRHATNDDMRGVLTVVRDAINAA